MQLIQFRVFCSKVKTYAALLTWWIHCMYGVMGLGLKSRSSQNYVGQPLLVPVPMPVPVRVHGNIKMSAIVAPKKIAVAPTTFSPVKDRFPFPGIHYRCSLRQMLCSTLVNRTFLYLSRSLSSPLFQKRWMHHSITLYKASTKTNKIFVLVEVVSRSRSTDWLVCQKWKSRREGLVASAWSLHTTLKWLQYIAVVLTELCYNFALF